MLIFRKLPSGPRPGAGPGRPRRRAKVENRIRTSLAGRLPDRTADTGYSPAQYQWFCTPSSARRPSPWAAMWTGVRVSTPHRQTGGQKRPSGRAGLLRLGRQHLQRLLRQGQHPSWPRATSSPKGAVNTLAAHEFSCARTCSGGKVHHRRGQAGPLFAHPRWTGEEALRQGHVRPKFHAGRRAARQGRSSAAASALFQDRACYQLNWRRMVLPQVPLTRNPQHQPTPGVGVAAPSSGRANAPPA